MFRLKTFFLSLISLLLFATPVLAGGGPVYIEAGSTLSSWNNPSSPRQIVATVHLHPDVTCVGTKITFKYEDQKDGDAVTTGSGESSYVIQEVGARWLNGKSVYDCGTYAKYTSKNKELKYGVIVVSTPKGETYERKIALNFQSNDPITSSGETLPWDNEASNVNPPTPTSAPTNTPYPRPEGSISVWILNQQFIAPFYRGITIRWSALQGNIFYRVYSKQADENGNVWKTESQETYGPSYDLKMRADENYYVKIQGCLKKIGTCVNSNELFVPKLQEQNGKIVIPSPMEPTISSDTAQLQQKVDNLQKQLQESQKRQANLEQTVNNLVKWIKSFFPFFK